MTSFPSAILSINSTASCLNAPTVRPFILLDSTYVFYREIVDIYVVSALCLAGLLGNVLSILVLKQDRGRSRRPNTTNWLLQTLAVVDTVYLGTCVLIQPIKAVYDYTEWFDDQSVFHRIFPYIEPHAWAAASIAQTTTVWVVVLVTADRYIAVCRPMQVKWRSLHRAKLAVLVVTFTAIVYNIPRFLEREVVVGVTCHGYATPKIRKTTLRNDRHYFLIYKTICYFVFRSIGPLVTLVLLNVQLIRTLRVVHLRHTALTRNLKQRENLTTMLVGVVSVFIVCQLPDLGIRIVFTSYEFASGTVRLDMTALKYANSASNALLTLNSSVNFLVYCFLGRKFRRILLQWLCMSPAAGQSTATDVRTESNHRLQRENAVRLNPARLSNISNNHLVEVTMGLKNTSAVQMDNGTALV